MNRKRAAIAIGVVGVIAVIGLICAAWLDVRTSVYTDGDRIRTLAADSGTRRILWQPPQQVPGGVNTQTDEYEPRVSADGTLMVFVRGKAGANAELFSCRWTPDGWTAPAPIAEINTKYDELGPELSRDGRTLYFYSDRPGGLGDFDLWVSTATDKGWGEPSNLGPSINTDSNEYGPALTPDGKTLYFASNRPRADEPGKARDAWPATVRESRDRHDYDLYSCELKNGSPESVAPVAELNSPFDEGAPAVSPVGDFLYFASDRPGGLGGFDVYRARRGKTACLEAENLGSQINSAFNDLDPGLSTDGFRLYFSSNRIAEAATKNSESRELDYGLWVAGSREVYLEHDGSGAWRAAAELWTVLWPWLLLMLLAPLLGLLLWRLFREPRWAAEFRKLSLLAQCVLISLLIHALLASGLAVWKVGSKLGDMLRQGGGTRVILASSGVSGEAAGQIRAGITSGLAIEPELNAERPELTVAQVEAPTARLDAPAIRTVASERPSQSQERESTPAERGPVIAKEAPDLRTITHAQLPQVAPGERAEEAAREPTTPSVSQIRPAIEPATIAPAKRTEVDPGKVTVRSGNTPTAIATERSDSATSSTPGVIGRDVKLATNTVGAKSVSLPHVEAPDAGDSEAGLQAGEVKLASTERAPITNAGGSIQAGMVATDPGALKVNGGGPRVAAEPVDAASEVAKAIGASRIASAPAARGSVDVRLPVAPAGNASNDKGEGEVTEAVQARGEVIAPGRLGAPGPVATVPDAARVDVDPGRINPGSAPTRGSGALPEAEHAGDTVGNLPRFDGAPAIKLPGTSLHARLPAGTPAATEEKEAKPLENFAQRAPETRQELVERMGGSKETERAVGSALEWFARHQSADGRWSGQHFDDTCAKCANSAEIECDGAMTGMVLLCYLGAGHTQVAEGPYKEAVGKAIRWVVSRQEASGDLRRGETMYSHNIATVALCEAFAMTQDKEVGAAARKAVAFMLDAQRAANTRRGKTDETSVLGWQVMAIESARRAGFDVPASGFAAAREWLEYVSASGSRGRYSYRPGESPSAAMTAEAMFVQQLLGHARTESRMEESARFILATPPKWQDGAPTYYWYYATLALFQHQGDAWREWNEQVSRELLAHQHTQGNMAGSWDPQDYWSKLGGRVYQTAVCTLSLEVYYRYKAVGEANGPRAR